MEFAVIEPLCPTERSDYVIKVYAHLDRNITHVGRDLNPRRFRFGYSGDRGCHCGLVFSKCFARGEQRF